MSYKKLKEEEEEEELLDRDQGPDIEKDALRDSLTREDGVIKDGKSPPDSPDGLITTSFGGQEFGEYEGPESEPLVVEDGDEFGGGLVDDEDHLRSGLGILEQESKRFRYLRRVLAVGSFVLLGLLLIAAIVLIALSPSCEVAAQGLPWWKSTVIYQCYPQSFQDSDRNGVGDLNGIKSRVDYFVDLGVQTVWLNPIYRSPGKDNGYDVSNYTDINPLFGTLADFKSLLDELHNRDIKILLDFVPNHTSDEHPWFQESRSGLDSPKRDWYVWADPGNGGGPPNNWISLFGGSAWTLDNLTGQYYLHQFSEFQPDLNYRNPDVLSAMEEVLEFWLAQGVDGFRVDAAQFLVEDSLLRNESRNPDFHGPEECVTNISSANCYNSLIHNLTANVPPIHDIIRNWRAVLNSSDRFMVGEVYNDIKTVMSYYGPNLTEFNFPFNFFLLENKNWTGTAVSMIVSEWLDNMPPGAWPNWVLGNHDNSRIASKAGVRLARALNVLLLTLPGTPTTYYGEEIMMTDVYVPPPQRHDPYDDRDKERTPMQWNSTAHAGFTSGNATWLPVADNYTKVNVFVESTNDTSMLSLYKKLTEIRSNHNALLYSDYELVLNSTSTYAYRRYHSSTTEEFLVVINFSDKPVKLDLHLSVTLRNPVIDVSSNLNRTGELDLKSFEAMAGEALLIRGQNC